LRNLSLHTCHGIIPVLGRVGSRVSQARWIPTRQGILIRTILQVQAGLLKTGKKFRDEKKNSKKNFENKTPPFRKISEEKREKYLQRHGLQSWVGHSFQTSAVHLREHGQTSLLTILLLSLL
jgi:hypothetical protein